MSVNQNTPSIQELVKVLATSGNTQDLQKASKILNKVYLKNPNSISSLIQIIAQNQNQGIRHLAAIEARKMIQKDSGALWEIIDFQIRERIKQSLFEMVLIENSLIRHSLAHIISCIAKNDIPMGRWDTLINILIEYCNSANSSHREIGVYILFSLFDVIADRMESYIPQLMELFSRMINDENLKVQITTVQALGRIAEFIDEQDQKAINEFQNLIPLAVKVLEKCLCHGDDDGVNIIFQVFDDLIVLEASLLSKHFIDLIKLFLSISASTEYSDQVRIRSISFLMWSISISKSKISKSKLIQPILSSMFNIAAEEEQEHDDSDCPASIAVQVISTLATTFSPQQVFPDASALAVQGLQSANPGLRKSSMLTMAVLVEGCADYMRPHLKNVMDLVVVGMNDGVPMVQRAACMALGALCDDFEEEVCAEHGVLVPLLFSLIKGNDASVISGALSTLDVLSENIGQEILPYVDGLMTCLFSLWDNNGRKIQISATNCIGSVAYAAGKDFLPYYQHTISRLSVFMTSVEPADLALRSVATDCIGAVATAVGKEIFREYLGSVMHNVIMGIELENSQLKQCSYVLCGVLGNLFEMEFVTYLNIVVPKILESCQLLEENEIGNVEIGQEEEPRTIASGIAQEKESSLDTLGELFSSTKSAFIPHVPDSINTALELLDHYHSSVRISAAGCLLKMFSTAYGIASPADWEAGLPLKQPLHENVSNIGKLAMEGVLLLFSDEDDRSVVTESLMFLTLAIKSIGPAVFCQQFSGGNPTATGSHLDMAANQLLLILRGEHSCQVSDDMGYTKEESDEDLAELDALVISAAADMVSAMSSALGRQFIPYFSSFLPLISLYYKENKPVPDRCMAIGSLAEAAEGLEDGVSEFTNELMNLFIAALNDKEEEVRSNAAYGIGILCINSRSDVVAFYPRLLELLSPLFFCTATNAKDNACGALSRMIYASPQNVPLEIAIPLILDSLPLKKDFEENRPVFKCILALLHSGNHHMLKEMPRLMNIFSNVLASNQLDSETRSNINQFLNK